MSYWAIRPNLADYHRRLGFIDLNLAPSIVKRLNDHLGLVGVEPRAASRCPTRNAAPASETSRPLSNRLVVAPSSTPSWKGASVMHWQLLVAQGCTRSHSNSALVRDCHPHGAMAKARFHPRPARNAGSRSRLIWKSRKSASAAFAIATGRNAMKTITLLLGACALAAVSAGTAAAGPCTTEIDNVTKLLASKDAGAGPTAGGASATTGQHPPSATMGAANSSTAASSAAAQSGQPQHPPTAAMNQAMQSGSPPAQAGAGAREQHPPTAAMGQATQGGAASPQDAGESEPRRPHGGAGGARCAPAGVREPCLDPGRTERSTRARSGREGIRVHGRHPTSETARRLIDTRACGLRGFRTRLHRSRRPAQVGWSRLAR